MGNSTTISGCQLLVQLSGRPASGRFDNWLVPVTLTLGGVSSTNGSMSSVSIQSNGAVYLQGHNLGKSVALINAPAF